MSRRIFCVLIAALILSAMVLSGWALYKYAYNDGRYNPDWSRFDLYIYPQDNMLILQDDSGHGCTWFYDPADIILMAGYYDSSL